MQQVRILKSIAGAGFSYGANTITWLKPAFARSLIRAGKAEVFQQTPPEVKTEIKKVKDVVQTENKPKRRTRKSGRGKTSSKGRSK